MFLSTNNLSIVYTFPGNISLFPLILWFVLYLILQAFTNQNAAGWYAIKPNQNKQNQTKTKKSNQPTNQTTNQQNKPGYSVEIKFLMFFD